MQCGATIMAVALLGTTRAICKQFLGHTTIHTGGKFEWKKCKTFGIRPLIPPELELHGFLFGHHNS